MIRYLVNLFLFITFFFHLIAIYDFFPISFTVTNTKCQGDEFTNLAEKLTREPSQFELWKDATFSTSQLLLPR